LGADRTVCSILWTGWAKRKQGFNGGPTLAGPVKARLKRLAGRRWTKDGAVIIFCDETRHQARNREIARDRLSELIEKALHVPKRRRPTRPTKGSVERRIKAKKVRGDVKALRGKVDE
jgi:ribosome-associated protein